MASAIIPTVPVGPVGHASDLRANFAAAKTEIEDLQARILALEQVNFSTFATKEYVDAAVASVRSTLEFEYSFNLSTSAPPSSGQVRMDQADQPLATTLWISTQTADGTDATLFLGMLKAGSSIILQDKDDSTKAQAYQVTGLPAAEASAGASLTVLVSWLKGNDPLVAQRILVTLAI